MTGVLSMLGDALLEALYTLPQLWKHLLLTRFRPTCFLTTQELWEIQRAVDAYELPSPRGWAHALSLGSLEKAKNTFSPDRIYTGSELSNLRGLLVEAELDNPKILEKISRAVRRAERLGVWTA